MTRSSDRPRKQLGNIPLQVLIGRDADGVLHAPVLQGLVDPRIGKGSPRMWRRLLHLKFAG